MVFLVTGVFLLSTAAAAVNTYCVAGPSNEVSHSTHKTAINRCNNELNDYYKNQGQLHQKYQNGRWTNEHISFFQRYQPQHYILNVHGTGGYSVTLGRDGRKDMMLATYYDANIYVGGTRSFNHAGAPFSAVVFAACKSAKDPWGKTSFKDVWMSRLYAWIYVGNKGNEGNIDNMKFLVEYSDEITDGKKTYRRAIQLGVNKASRHYDLIYYYWKSGFNGLHHDTKDDKYRKIWRVESDEGTSLGLGEDVTLTYNGGTYQHTTNGAYMVVHGTVNNIVNNYDEGEIEIKVEKWTGSQYVPISSHTFTVINRECDVGVPVFNPFNTYGGSDICTLRIPPNIINNVGQNQHLLITTTFDSDEADDFKIDRNELMIIGK